MIDTKVMLLIIWGICAIVDYRNKVCDAVGLAFIVTILWGLFKVAAG